MPEPTPNPYRQILGRRFPEPFIALLAFLLGVWLWDHYFSQKRGFEPGTDQVAMVKLDRDFRLAEAMAGDPAWLRWAMGVDMPEAVKHDGGEALLLLDKDREFGSGLGPQGGEALIVVLSEQQHTPLLERLRQIPDNGDGEVFPEAYETLVTRMMEGRGKWWERSILRAYAAERPTGAELPLALKTFDDGSRLLRERTLVSRGAVWLLVLAGTCFIPTTIRRLLALRGWKDRGYGRGWSASLGLVVFLAATLAWIGFGLAMRAGLMAVKDIPPWMMIALDGAMRFLPALIVMGLLFRRAGHAVRVMGLNRSPRWPMVLGIFAILGWYEQLVSPLLRGISELDPSGGLSAGEEGVGGLAFALISACLMAPLAEEIVYRGVLFRTLANRFGLLAGALLSSGAFALVHFYNLSGLVSVAVFGFACALAYSSTRALSTAVVLHLLYNAAIKLPEWMVYHAPLH